MDTLLAVRPGHSTASLSCDCYDGSTFVTEQDLKRQNSAIDPDLYVQAVMPLLTYLMM